MNSVVIDKRICLESKFLDQEILQHLLEKIKKTTLKECTNDYGYIIEVKKIIKIVEHEIGRANTENVFLVRFEALTLKPEPGKKMVGKVCMVYKDGIFITIMGKQRMLIPKSYLTDYTYNEADCCYENDKNVIRNDDEISSIVTASQYNKQSFSCFGSLA